MATRPFHDDPFSIAKAIDAAAAAVVSTTAAPAALTDSSGGTASSTLAAISDTATKNAVASLNHQFNLLITALKTAKVLE